MKKKLKLSKANLSKEKFIKITAGSALILTMLIGISPKEKANRQKKDIKNNKSTNTAQLDEKKYGEAISISIPELDNSLSEEQIVEPLFEDMSSDSREIGKTLESLINFSTEDNILESIDDEIESTEEVTNSVSETTLTPTEEVTNSVSDVSSTSTTEEVEPTIQTNVENSASFMDSKGDYWVSEADYLSWLNGGEFDFSQCFVAPDGSYWDSEELYNEYVSGIQK